MINLETCTAGGEVNSLGIVFEGSRNARPVELSKTDNQDGTCTIRFIGRGENQHKITPTLNNVVIGTGFYSVDVLPGALSAPNSFVVGLGISKAFPNSVASMWNRFTIQGRDQYNNTLRAPVNAFAVSVTYPDGTIRYLQTNVDVFYNQAGSHIVLWRSTTAGVYSISVLHNSDPIYKSAFSIIFDPGAAYGPTSYFAGAGASASVAGAQAQFTVTSRDRWNNELSVAGANYKWWFTGPVDGRELSPIAGQCPTQGCVDQNNGAQSGQHVVSYTPTAAGRYSLAH